MKPPLESGQEKADILRVGFFDDQDQQALKRGWTSWACATRRHFCPG
ncbi:MAG: hypothetical protein KJ958_04500 [Gammaproteobacteria bacterium]|nr:hypothetical protein [Gammaproteobacteria bacterium]MBU1978414.1 hypothetical protein [Gammaproteobacteria bacterium]